MVKKKNQKQAKEWELLDTLSSSLAEKKDLLALGERRLKKKTNQGLPTRPSDRKAGEGGGGRKRRSLTGGGRTLKAVPNLEPKKSW